VSRSKNREAAFATIRALAASSVFWSTMNTKRRPTPPPSFVLTGTTPGRRTRSGWAAATST
jgi:hypothetical protein